VTSPPGASGASRARVRAAAADVLADGAIWGLFDRPEGTGGVRQCTAMAAFRTRLRSSVLLGPLVGLALFGGFLLLTRWGDGVAPPSLVLALGALFAGVRLLTWLSTRAELEPGGRLVVTGPWPGRRHAVDLATLKRVAARQQVTGTGGRDSRMRVHDTLELLDDSGGGLSLRVREWARADLLIAAVEQAAAQRALPVTGAELFGMQTAAAPAPPPAPAAPAAGGPLPVLDLRLQHRFIYGFIGTIFTALGTTALLFAAGTMALLSAAPPIGGRGAGFSLLPLLIAAIFPCIGVALLSLAFGARLALDADGDLRVRTNPPWRTRRLALAELTAASASHAGYISVNRRPARSKVALRLADRSGRTVTVDPGAWEHPEAIAGAVAAAAAGAEVALDPGTARYLALGVPPTPTGLRPTAGG